MASRGILASVFAVLMAFGLSAGKVSAAESYTFMGLAWGSSPEQARAHLEQRGFEFQGDMVTGPQREFHMDRALGVYREVDRGNRLVARGRMGGMPVTVHLVFGEDQQLDHVILRSENWNGTLAHARQITALARTLTEMFEEQFGHAERSQIHGYVDTAVWRPAEDGSRVNLYIRGTNGYMFYPNDETALRVHFANLSYRNYGAPVTTIVSLRTFSTGTETATRAEQTTPEVTEESLRRMYQQDPLGQ